MKERQSRRSGHSSTELIIHSSHSRQAGGKVRAPITDHVRIRKKEREEKERDSFGGEIRCIEVERETDRFLEHRERRGLSVR